jgi:hypothetical protein
MGGFSTQGMTSQQNPQQAAANGVKATAGSSPSLGQMQQGMGGLLGNETQQGAFDNFFGGLKETFMPFFGGLMDRGEGTLTDNPNRPPEPELSPYEARIQELMKNREWSRDDAVANQASAMKQGGDFNNDGAVTNDEWAQWRQQQTPQQTPPAAATPDNTPTNLFELPEKTQKALENFKKLGGLFR